MLNLPALLQNKNKRIGPFPCRVIIAEGNVFFVSPERPFFRVNRGMASFLS